MPSLIRLTSPTHEPEEGYSCLRHRNGARLTLRAKMLEVTLF